MTSSQALQPTLDSFAAAGAAPHAPVLARSAARSGRRGRSSPVARPSAGTGRREAGPVDGSRRFAPPPGAAWAGPPPRSSVRYRSAAAGTLAVCVPTWPGPAATRQCAEATANATLTSTLRSTSRAATDARNRPWVASPRRPRWWVSTAAALLFLGLLNRAGRYACSRVAVSTTSIPGPPVDGGSAGVKSSRPARAAAQAAAERSTAGRS